MKVLFDTNIYIAFIRNRTHAEELNRRGTVKYLSGIVLMELWAGARSKDGKKLIQRLQKPYADASRIVTLSTHHYAAIGRFFAGLPRRYDALLRMAGFVNDVQIAFTALSTGATLFTEDRDHFEIIKNNLRALKVEYLP